MTLSARLNETVDHWHHDQPAQPNRIELDNHTGFIVYQLYDQDGQLLYVGQTVDLIHRLSSHRHSSVFGPQISYATWEHCATRTAMCQREAELILSRQPPHNTVGTGNRTPDRSLIHHKTALEDASQSYRRAMLRLGKGLGVDPASFAQVDENGGKAGSDGRGSTPKALNATGEQA